MSSSKLPITIVIPTINAEVHLNELFDSIVPYFEEVVVVDSLSLDRTVDICLERGVKVIQRPFTTSSNQFGWMLTKMPIATPWVMMMAQDERMTEGLRKQISEKVVADSPYNGFTVKWRLWFMGRPLHVVSSIPRIFRKGSVAVTNVTCNEHFETKGSVGALCGILEHKDTPTLWDWYEKQNIYSSREAIGIVTGRAREEKARFWGTHNERMHWCALKLPKLPLGLGYLAIFLGYYFKNKAWLDGYEGYIWARCRTWVKWVTQLKANEMRCTGVIPKMPTARHGDFDPRIMRSELQKQLLPGLVAEWEAR